MGIGRVTIPAGQTSGTIRLNTLAGNITDPSGRETVTVTLKQVISGPAAIGTPDSAQAGILATDVVVEPLFGQIPASNQSVQYTTPNLKGLTPKAVICFGGPNQVANARSSGFAECWGMATPSAQVGFGCRDTNAVSSSDTDHGGNVGDILSMIDPGGANTFVVRGTITSFDTNGITINWTVTDGNTYNFGLLFFAGNELQAHVATALTENANRVDIGFRPHAIIGMSQDGSINGGTGTFRKMSWGLAQDTGGAPLNRGFSQQHSAGLGTMAPRWRCDDDYIIGEKSSGAGYFHKIAIGTIDNTGYNAVVVQGGNTRTSVNYLALNFGTKQFDVRRTQLPTSGGWTENVGFQPQCVLVLASTADGGPGADDNDDYFSHGLSCFTENAQIGVSNHAQRAVATSNVGTMMHNNAAVVNLNNAGALDYLGTLNAFNSTGWEVGFSTQPARGSQVLTLAIE